MEINFQDLFKLLRSPIVKCNRNNLKPVPPGSPLAARRASEDLIVCSQQEAGEAGAQTEAFPPPRKTF